MKKNRSMTKTRRSGTHLLLRLLMGVCLLGVLSSVYILFVSQREYTRGDAAYAQVRTLLEEQHETELRPDSVSEASVVAEARQVDFTALRQINADAVAWITAEESVIDYPVVQGKDNDYYLNHLFTGQKNKLGSLFVDYRTPGDFSGKSTVIYGHNMKDGSMFASLTDYRDQAYYDEHSVMQLYTPDGSYSIEFFAGILADGDYEFLRLEFDDDRDFLEYIGELKVESTFQSEVDVQAEDRIVVLCTCSYEFNNARYALFGKLIPLD
ncbi:class B sortase [Paenibacillus sp. FSL R5-0407]|uniref:class B sortase n=1 Tax=Paenibacillus sp. FSL R5-0407 TaxID=2975320 RepID=UPI0030F726F4